MKAKYLLNVQKLLYMSLHVFCIFFSMYANRLKKKV